MQTAARYRGEMSGTRVRNSFCVLASDGDVSLVFEKDFLFLLGFNTGD